MCHGHRPAGRTDGIRRTPRDGHADSDDGRHPLGSRDQHPRPGRCTAGIRRRVGHQRPHHRLGIRRGLSAGRRGHHLHDDIRPLCPAREIRERGRGAGGTLPGAEIRRQGFGRIHQQNARRTHGGLYTRPDKPPVRHFAHHASRRDDHDGRRRQRNPAGRPAVGHLAGRGHRGNRGFLRPPRGADRRTVGQQYAQRRTGVAPYPDYQIVAQRQEILRSAPAHQVRHHYYARQPRRRRPDSLPGTGAAGGRPRDGRRP